MATGSSSNVDLTNDDARWEALARFFAGESTPAEADAVSAWLASQPRQANALSTLDAAVTRLAATSAREVDVERALRSVQARRGNASVRPLRSQEAATISPALWRGLGLAAAACLAVAAGALLQARVRGGRVPPPLAARVFTTTIGQRDSIRLSDSTLVVLGPASTLAIASGYGASHREVALRGEAFFEVVHDASNPFIVTVPGAVIRDIGTAFSVRGDSGQSVRVVVTSGSVILRAVGDSASDLRLSATDVAVVDLAGKMSASPGKATDADVAWRSGRLVFDGATLPEVRDALRRWYGADLQVDHGLADRHVTASFNHEPLAQVIAVLSRTLGAHAEQRGSVVLLQDGVTPQANK